MKSRVIWGVVSLLIFFTASASSAGALWAKQPPRYSVILLGEPANESEWADGHVRPTSINNRGDVVGVTAFAPVLYRDRRLRYLWPAEEGYFTYFPPAINDRGIIAAIAFPLDGNQSPSAIAFTYPTLGRTQPFTLAGASIFASRWFVPRDMSGWGTIVGELRDTPLRTAVVYRDGEVRTLPPLSPGGEAVANAINSRGQIVGTSGAENFSHPFFPTRAVIWSDGRVRDLGLLPGCVNAYGVHINDRGEAVGSCDDASEEAGLLGNVAHGFIWRNGVMRRVPVPAGTQSCAPVRINNRGDVLINYFPRRSSDLFYYGWWLYSGGVLHEVDEIVAKETGWRLAHLELCDINDRGEIVGYAQYSDPAFRSFTQGILLVPDHDRTQSRISGSNGRFIGPRNH